MKNISFTKMHGCNNEFLVVDNRYQNITEKQLKHLPSYCNRKTSIGADSVLVIENSRISDATMRILEIDGSESDMCGNGIRCVAKYLLEQSKLQNPLNITTRSGTYTINRFNNLFRVNMGHKAPISRYDSIIDNHTLYFINTGEPHIVIFVREIDNVNLISLAKKIRNCTLFSENSANINIVELNSNSIKIRTYERGIEGETLACGTGSTAAALVASNIHNLKMPLTVITKGGNLEINNVNNDIYMTGPAEFVYRGNLSV